MRNAAGAASARDSCRLVRVIPTNEGLMIARHTHKLVFRDSQETGHA
jgi:acetate kinase